VSAPTTQRPGAVTEHTSRHGTVTVTEEIAETDWAGMLVVRYIITSPPGFRADLTACCSDRCLSGEVKCCTTPTGDRGQHSVGGKSSIVAWLKHSASHCHGWHPPTVEQFASDVLKTLGTRPARKQPTLPGVTAYMRRLRVLADCPAWPVPVDKPLPPPCDCSSCSSTLALIGVPR
jgi:hypothetical protein